MNAAERKALVREFCRRFYAALEREHWGDIEPELFRSIAEADPPEDISEEFAEWRESLEAALDEAFEGLK